MNYFIIRSKTEGKDSKNKFIEIDASKGVRVTPLTMVEPKEKSLLQQAQPSGVMWSIGDGKGGSVDIKVIFLFNYFIPLFFNYFMNISSFLMRSYILIILQVLKKAKSGLQ